MLKIETSIVDINNMADTEEKLEVSIQLGEEKAEISEEAKIEAEKLKTEANEYFKNKKFNQAIELYSRAIELNPTAVYYGNRAFAQMKMENYGAAIEDANNAIELDNRYIKAYYRRGSAYLSLGKFKQALRDFKSVSKIHPRDEDARLKLRQCERAVRELEFAKAIETEHTRPMWETLDLSIVDVPVSYDGPHLENSITQDFVLSMIERFKDQKLVHKKYIQQILLWSREILAALPTLFEVEIEECGVNGKLTVCGDTHGQFYDLVNIFEINGYPSPENPYLFNGDFVDRGSFSVEVIMTLLAYKVLYPNHFHLTRGNHESISMNKMYGFEGEVRAKIDEPTFRLFTEVFQSLPLCCVVNHKVFITHGGLFSRDGVTLDEIRATNRICEPPESGIMCELLWSDPQPMPGRGMSKRGVGTCFGPDVTNEFLSTNGLELVVRSHEMRDAGYTVEHGGKLITIFSAPNYCDQMGNKGAFITFRSDCIPQFTQFDAVPHPDIRPMAYGQYGGLLGM